MIVVKKIVYKCHSSCGNSYSLGVDREIRLSGTVDLGNDKLCLKCGRIMVRSIETEDGGGE